MWLKRLNSGIIASLILFLVGLPLVLQINFYQNDDWAYYRMVENFMRGNFTLDPVSAPTFYFQGFLAMLFALVFGINRLPVLTLVISLVSFYLLYKILINTTKLGTRLSLLVALIWFFNPINIYSSLGFMTENYLLFCLLGSLYFFTRYTNKVKWVDFALFNLFLFLGLMTKQSTLALIASYPIYFLANKNWRLFGWQTFISAVLFAFYFLIFPQTAEMHEKPLQFHHLLDLPYLSQLLKVIFIYISAFCFPLLILLLPTITSLKKYKRFVISVLVIMSTLAIFFFIFKNFKPNSLAWQEFFYLDNTLERRGFYPRGVMGTKYYFRGMYDLYKYWDLTAKLFVGIVLTALVWSVRKVKSHAHILAFFVVYLVLMLLAEKVYDRYIPPLFLAFILLVSANFNYEKLGKLYKKSVYIFLVSFLSFFIMYSYQFAMDFVLVNKYIWNRSLELVEKENLSPKLIKGTNAWKLSDYNLQRNYLYDFTFDDIGVNKKYGEQYDLVEKTRIDFVGSLWLDPYVYLYKKKNFSNVII